MDRPFFTIVIPTYNRSALIGKTVNSVLQQSFTDFEVIVVDDGSTDNTADIIDKIEDRRLCYFRKANAERAAARNFGVQHSNGRYVTFLDSDDLLYPNHLEEAMLVLQKHPQLEVFSLSYDIRYPDGKLIKNVVQNEQNTGKVLLTGNPLSCIGVFIREDICRENPFNENKELAGSEDWVLWCRLAARYRFCSFPAITATLVQHESRSVLNMQEEQLKKRMELVFKYLFEDEPFLKKYGQYKNITQSHFLLYVALHLALSGKGTASLPYWLKAVRLSPTIIFNRKTLGYLKRYLYSFYQHKREKQILSAGTIF